LAGEAAIRCFVCVSAGAWVCHGGSPVRVVVGFGCLSLQCGGSGSRFSGLGAIEESFQESCAQSLLEFEEQLYAGKVHASLLSKAPYPQNAPDIVLRVEPDIGRGSRGGQQSLVFVDSQGARVSLNQARRHAYHKAGAPGVLLETSI
jgi:hypothetical protein